MNLNLTSTDRIVQINGVTCRIWKGVSANGVPVHAFIATVAVLNNHDYGEFEADLQQHAPASEETKSFPLKMFIP